MVGWYRECKRSRKFGVLVLSKMADMTAAVLDDVARSCLARAGAGRAVATADVVLLRRVMQVFLPLVPAVPAALLFVAGPAVALPLGFALVLSLFLLASVVAFAVARAPGRPGEVADAPAADGFSADACPGLLLRLDAKGLVRAAGGRDREVFFSFLRDPIDRPFVEHVHVSDRLGFVEALADLRAGVDAVAIDLRLDRPMFGLEQSQFMNVRMDMTAVRGADGALCAVHAQILDIAGEMRIRDEARRMAGEAADAHETKSRFLAAVSHELRTPLNAILGFSDILAGEYFGKLENDRQREYVGLIHQSGAHLLSVVNAMLDMSKIEAGRYELTLEPFAIAETISHCENMLSLQAKTRGVTLTSRLGRSLGEVVADERAVRQVLINLVGNAIKFTEAGGAVTIDAGVEGGELKIVVSDTGIGIAPEKLSLIGKPFTQIHGELNRRYEGSGLGLSLVKGLTALHGGRFEMTSRPGEGTVVTVTLPADGSGIIAAADAAGADNRVDFPPRLKAEDACAARTKDEWVHDEAKAKIA